MLYDSLSAITVMIKEDPEKFDPIISYMSIIVALIGVIVALVNWLLNYRSQQALTIQKARLDLIDRQLSNFYGPLYIMSETGYTSYNTLLVKLNRPKGVFNQNPPPSEAQIQEWIHWMIYVFNPLNEKRDNLIRDNCHLLIDNQMPNCFLDFSAHVACYRAILPKWQNNDFSEPYAKIDYPTSLRDYAIDSFVNLKKEQEYILGRLKKRERGKAK